MRSNMQYPVNIKLTITSLFFLFFVLFIIRATFSSSSSSPPSSRPTLLPMSPQNPLQSLDCRPNQEINPINTVINKCSKIPPSISESLIHYATSNITPQQTFQEISVTNRVLFKKSPSNFLVFGLGYDSMLWSTLNYNGRTVFLEEDAEWIRKIKQKFRDLEAYHVNYDTKVYQSEELLAAAIKSEECKVGADPRDSKCLIAHKGLPKEIYEVEWDLIMVDAPTGWNQDAPGRMTAIYTAGLMARNRESGETDVFVHDVDRTVEDKFSKEFLCQGYLTEQVGRLRRFTIPSHRARAARPFCPIAQKHGKGGE